MNAEARWLAVYTRPRFETKVKQFCDRRGIEAFLPTHRSLRQWSDRRVVRDFPLFPSYLFARPGSLEVFRVASAPGFLSFVSNNFGPVEVEASEIESIRRLLASGLQYDPLPGIEPGDEVEITRGPMRGCCGRLLRKDPNAVVLCVTAVGGAVRVKLADSCAIRRRAQ